MSSLIADLPILYNISNIIASSFKLIAFLRQQDGIKTKKNIEQVF